MRQKKKSLTRFAFFGFLLFCVVTATTAQTPQQIAQKAFRSTVLLVMEDTNGQPLSLGSGFFVKDDQIATESPCCRRCRKRLCKIGRSKDKVQH